MYTQTSEGQHIWPLKLHIALWLLILVANVSQLMILMYIQSFTNIKISYTWVNYMTHTRIITYSTGFPKQGINLPL